MPIFTTPAPIDLAINLPVGAIEVIASNRSDTVVTVTPTSDKPSDRRGADETQVALDGDRLTITAPKPRFSIVGPTESVDIRVELPTGSRLTAEITMGVTRTRGTLGATRVKSGHGHVELENVGDLWVRAAHGNVTAGVASGDVEITCDHGQIRLASVSGSASLKSSHGSATVGAIGADLDAKLSYGDLEVASVGNDVVAKTAYGSIQLREVSAGSTQIESGYGGIAVAVKKGVPAWLDLSSKNGRVRNHLEGNRPAEDGEQSVAVRARTQFGDIEIASAS